MRAAQVTSLVLQSELFLLTLFLRAWHYGTGFAIRHYLPDYPPLCGATFLIRYLVHMLSLPMSHKNLKQFFF